jgi:hypothetical protein
MIARPALLFLALTTGAQAAAFDDLKGYLASCLRFEMGGGARQGVPLSNRVHGALDRCAEEVERLDRADGRRLRGDGGLSPSTKQVIEAVIGRGKEAGRYRGGLSPVRYPAP